MKQVILPAAYGAHGYGVGRREKNVEREEPVRFVCSFGHPLRQQASSRYEIDRFNGRSYDRPVNPSCTPPRTSIQTSDMSLRRFDGWTSVRFRRNRIDPPVHTGTTTSTVSATVHRKRGWFETWRGRGYHARSPATNRGGYSTASIDTRSFRRIRAVDPTRRLRHHAFRNASSPSRC